jgi:hypothetical protein
MELLVGVARNRPILICHQQKLSGLQLHKQ